MAAANGTLTPPSLPPAATTPIFAKRKRTDTDANAANGASTAAINGASHSLQAVLEDIVSVLKRYVLPPPPPPDPSAVLPPRPARATS